MLSTAEICFLVALGIGLAGWWVAASLARHGMEDLVEQTADTIGRAVDYWQGKLDEPGLGAYANAMLLKFKVELDELAGMRSQLAEGKRLSTKQIVRLEKLVCEHMVEQTRPASSFSATHGGAVVTSGRR